MPTSPPTPVIQLVQEEQLQGHSTRKAMFVELESLLGRPVISYFTSLVYPVAIEDQDADMIEGVLQQMDLSGGLAVLVNSHGGDGLAAERIINICRSASGTGDFWAIVAGKAKSAATMICFGASKVFMGASSELGPIDPQLIEEGEWFSLFNLVESYNDLFARAIRTKGNLQPFLQQLSHYDARKIAEYKAAIDLAADIAVKSLASGMMKGKTETAIKKKIEMFLSPKRTKTHGRPIYRDEARKCGLNIENVEIKERLGQVIYELNVRANNFVTHMAYKCIESKEHTVSAPIRHERLRK